MFERDEVLRDLRRRMNTAGSVGGFATRGAVAPGAVVPGAVVPGAVVPGAVVPGAVTEDSVTSDESRVVLPVAPPLAAVLPRGGLARGSVVSVIGQGATSLLFTLLAGPEASWSALVGMPGIGLLAAAEFGIDLDRLVVIPEPGPDVLQVLSILVDGVDMIAVALPVKARPSPSRQRVLTGRLRQHGAVLLVMGPWPGADLVLTASWVSWTGLGRGHGRLRDRELVVEVGGRGAAAGRRASAALLLRAGRTAIEIAPAVPVPVRVNEGTFEPVAEVG